MAGSMWNSIKVSRDTYENMKKLSMSTGLSMDSIIRELLTAPDYNIPAETLWITDSRHFYMYQQGGRAAVKYMSNHLDMYKKNDTEEKKEGKEDPK